MKYIFFFVCLMTNFGVYAQTSYLDSLEQELKKVTSDTTRIDILFELAINYIYNDPQKTISYCQESQQIAQKIGDKKREIVAVNRMGGGYWSKGDLGEALQCFRESMQLAKVSQNDYWVAKNIGNIGLIYSGIGNKNLAKNYYLQAYELFLEMKHTDRLASLLDNIGTMCLELHEYDSAHFYYQKVLESADTSTHDMHILYLNLGDLALRQQKLDEADSYLRRSLEISIQKADIQIIAYDYFFLADIHFQRNELDSALHKARKAVELAQQSGGKETLMEAYKVLSKILHALRQSDEAYEYYQAAINYKDSMQGVTNQKALQVFEFERKKGEIALLKAQKSEQEARFAQQNLQQRGVILTILGILISVLVVSFVIFRGRAKLQHMNQELSVANAEIHQQNEEIQSQSDTLRQANDELQSINYQLDRKNQNITASINYSLRIQRAILPSKSRIQQAFDDSFVLFRPRDIVSGDFYWFYQTNHLKIIALADCTGHGVSGALMTMIGNNILNQIVRDDKIYEPDLILNVIPDLLQKTLMYAETQIADGMDMSILMFENKNAFYAGAMNPLYYVENQELHIIKGDKIPIGGTRKRNFKMYQKHHIELRNPITFYLASDGFQDQFGGANQRKYMVKNFRKCLGSISHLPLQEQHTKLEQELQTWMGQNVEKQTDDITVIGIQIRKA